MRHYLKLFLLLAFLFGPSSAALAVFCFTGTSGGSNPPNCRQWQPTGTVVAANTSNFQTVYAGAAAGSIVQPAPGTYNLSGTVNLKSGVSIQCPSGGTAIFRLPVNSPQHFFHGNGISNTFIWNCKFDLTNYTGGGNCGITCAVFFIEGSSVNVEEEYNQFANFANAQAYAYLTCFNSDSIFFEKNTDDATSTFQPVNCHQTDAGAHHHMSISYNTFGSTSAGPNRIGIEVLLCTADDVHFDFNTIKSPNNIFAISLSDCGGVSNTTNCTTWGNQLTNVQGSGSWGIEAAMSDCDDEQNTNTNVDWPFIIAGHPVFIGANTVTGQLHTIGGEDGGYNSSETISVQNGTLNKVAGSNCIGGQGNCQVFNNLGIVPPTSYGNQTISHVPAVAPCTPI